MVESVEVKEGKKNKKTYVNGVWAVGPNKVRKALLLRNVFLGSYPLPKDGQGNIIIHGREPDRTFPFEEAITPPTSPQRTVGGVGDEEIAVMQVGSSTHGSGQNQLNAGSISSSNVECNAHGRVWKKQEVPENINGPVNVRQWEVLGRDNSVVTEGSYREGTTVMYFFESMFPMQYLATIVSLTNISLLQKRIQPTTSGEILRFFGPLILMTRYEFGSRRSLWSDSTTSRYIVRPHFGIAMSRTRFFALFSAIAFSNDTTLADDEQGTNGRWGPVADFVAAINGHRLEKVKPSGLLCVDKSMVRWYGLGGDWIDIGIHYYVSIDRKPESCCEIQNVACARSGIMLRLGIISSESFRSFSDTQKTCNHGTAVLKRLVEPWKGSNRIVCADSYFAWLESAETLLAMGFRFIGVVKTATRGLPMAYLSKAPMRGKGEHNTMITDSIVQDRSLWQYAGLTEIARILSLQLLVRRMETHKYVQDGDKSVGVRNVLRLQLSSQKLLNNIFKVPPR